MRSPLTKEDYFAARMISEPFCLFDYCLECDGAVAVVTTSSERARDLRQPPVYVTASAQGGAGSWGQSITWMGMPDEIFASSGHRPVARDLYRRAGLGPADVDVALIYDHFTGMVLMQLEDYGFCPIGESGPFVADGNIRYLGGTIPVNTHGGNLSDAYIIGFTHVVEGGRTATRHRDQPGRQRRGCSGYRRTGSDPRERVDPEEGGGRWLR